MELSKMSFSMELILIILPIGHIAVRLLLSREFHVFSEYRINCLIPIFCSSANYHIDSFLLLSQFDMMIKIKRKHEKKARKKTSNFRAALFTQ